MSSLVEVVEELRNSNEQLEMIEYTSIESNTLLDKICKDIYSIVTMFKKYMIDSEIERLEMLEVLRELKLPAQEREVPVAPSQQSDSNVPFIPIPAITKALAAIPASLAGFAAGYIAEFAKGFASLTKKLGTQFKKLFPEKEIFKNLKTSITDSVKNVKTKITTSFSSASEAFNKKVESVSKAVSAGMTKVSNFATKVKTFVTSFLGVTGVSTEIKEASKALGITGEAASSSGASSKFVTKIKTFFQPVTNFLKGFKSVFGQVFKFFKPIGKLFVPIEAIIRSGIEIYDDLTELDENASLMEQFGAVLKGLATGLGKVVTSFLDLGKDLVSWISEKLGFEDFSKMLDDFNFTELFEKGIENIASLIGDMFDGTFVDALGYLAKDIGEMATNLVKGALRAILPAPDILSFELPEVELPYIPGFGSKKIGGGKLNLNPIPDSLYEFAGINPVTGSVTNESSNISSSDASSQSSNISSSDVSSQSSNTSNELSRSSSRENQTQVLTSSMTENNKLNSSAASASVIAPSATASVSTSNVTNNISQIPTSPVDKFDRNVSAFG